MSDCQAGREFAQRAADHHAGFAAEAHVGRQDGECAVGAFRDHRQLRDVAGQTRRNRYADGYGIVEEVSVQRPSRIIDGMDAVVAARKCHAILGLPDVRRFASDFGAYSDDLEVRHCPGVGSYSYAVPFEIAAFFRREHLVEVAVVVGDEYGYLAGGIHRHLGGFRRCSRAAHRNLELRGAAIVVVVVSAFVPVQPCLDRVSPRLRRRGEQRLVLVYRYVVVSRVIGLFERASGRFHRPLERNVARERVVQHVLHPVEIDRESNPVPRAIG